MKRRLTMFNISCQIQIIMLGLIIVDTQMKILFNKQI